MVEADRSNHHRRRNVEQMDIDHGEGVGHIIADAEHEIFDGLNDADLADLDDRFAMATFRKGELIYSPFDRGEAMFLIESGRVRLFRSAADGRQVTLSMLDPGATFGQVSVLDEPMHDAYAEAMTDSVVRILRGAYLERTIGEHRRMALNLMRSLSERLRTAEDQIEALAFRPVPSRLAGKLLELMDRYGRVTPNGIRIDERFTHMQLAEMLKGGVIMDVTNAEQARIAEDAGACAVMALERVPADIRRDGGVARMADPDMIRGIQEAVTIPVMAKCRIGHFAEAQILQSLEIDYIDESEVLTPANLEHHVDKWQYTVPFVCGCTNLGEALRRIAEGAAMIRTKGEAGTGDIVNAVTHMRSVFGGIRRLQSLRGEELFAEAKNLQAPFELVRWVAENGRLPVVTFTAGGIATPSDAALCMQLGADGVFVGSGIFKSGNPSERARAIVEATTHYLDADVLARVSAGLGEAMVGISTQTLDPSELLERRGW